MEKKEIFSQVIHMEERIGTFHDELGELKEQLAMLIEENHALAMENQHLRELLDEKDTSEQSNETESSQDKATVGEGHDNLARLYHEGFHICNMHYGSLRAEGDCLFCLSFLNQK
ncbi:regulator of replication initiation timing [Salibacterium salarium]|uniref:Replication initiation control protein YabA n=1 Tax=Salibacterium salarium TaxID=284579 RepID=A0A3R9PG62_9BACI|nr:DNA replication initiation control protein YabA [Salibacterium salarium]MDQ0300937.1 regulator of replication initiation timing [Salibacterium salarium]RSL30020.1 DNA replication initiation control protein YabA [Salibacterium salarium]